MPRTPPPAPTKNIVALILAGWPAVALIGGTVFSIGMNWQQFAEVKKNQEVQSTEQKILASKLSEFREKQVGGLKDIETLKVNVQAIDNRVLVIERVFYEKPPRK